MNLPNVPTDNLYKFMAITGLLTTFISVGVFEYAIEKVSMSTDQVMLEATKLEIESTKVSQDLDRLDKEIGKIRLISTIQKINEKIQVQENLNTENKILLAEIKSRNLQNIRHAKLLKEYYFLYVLGVLGGLTLSFWGFRLWYTRVQKIEDELLNRKLKI